MIAVALFELIIFVHEGGHFIAAKKSGVKVNEFALGMGPKLFSFTKGETTYSLRLFPIGGYCAMEGEDEDSENPRAFNNAKIWKRMIIIVAGAAMNILFGMLLLLITLLPQDSFVSTQVASFSSCAVSSVTGLQEGDKIVRLNNYDINTSTDFSFALYTLPAQEVDGHELSIYKEDCVIDFFNYCQGLVDKDTTQEAVNALNTACTDIQPELAKVSDKKEAYQIFCRYIDKACKAVGKEKPEKYPEIEEKDTRQRFRTDISVIRNGERVELKGVDLHDRGIYDYANEAVARAGDDDKGLVFLPFLFGSNVNMNAKGAFIGLQSWHTRDDMLRAVYEGIVFSHKYHIEKLLKYRDAPDLIRMAGGVAKSKIWVQMFADILQVPIEVARSQELGALGSAINAGVAVGVFPSFKEASEQMVDVMYTAQPDLSKKDVYDRKYRRYLKVIDALDGVWDDWNE